MHSGSALSSVLTVKVLFIGDIVGEPGRRAVRSLIPLLRDRHHLDFVIANGENSAGGNGITSTIARDFFDAGIDVITTGDHAWDQKEIVPFLPLEPRLLRPLNYPPGVPGHGFVVRQKDSLPPVAVLNLQGRTFMPVLDNPFPAALLAVESLRTQTPIIFVDFHAEATSEKIAMGRMLDGKVSAVIGTHTHVQTADEQIFPGGTAYLSDAGFTGPQESILGREIDPIIQKFLLNTPHRFEVAKHRVVLHGAVIEVDASTGRAVSILRVAEPFA